jgi:hypothetical protein
MRCSASPTTSTVPDAATDANARARDTLAAIVFADILKPLAASLGPLGETLAATVADRAFAPEAK